MPEHFTGGLNWCPVGPGQMGAPVPKAMEVASFAEQLDCRIPHPFGPAAGRGKTVITLIAKQVGVAQLVRGGHTATGNIGGAVIEGHRARSARLAGDDSHLAQVPTRLGLVWPGRDVVRPQPEYFQATQVGRSGDSDHRQREARPRPPERNVVKNNVKRGIQKMESSVGDIVGWILQLKEIIALATLVLVIYHLLTKLIPFLLLREGERSEREAARHQANHAALERCIEKLDDAIVEIAHQSQGGNKPRS